MIENDSKGREKEDFIFAKKDEKGNIVVSISVVKEYVRKKHNNISNQLGEKQSEPKMGYSTG